MISIDLNCDMGEGFAHGTGKRCPSSWIMSRRQTSPVGFMPAIQPSCVELLNSRQPGSGDGLHPSYPDLQGFGRRNMSLDLSEVFDLVVYQIGVKAVCTVVGTELHHVKPHGALYNQAARNEELARAIAQAVRSIDDGLILYGLSGSFLIGEAEKIGLKTASKFCRSNLSIRRKSHTQVKSGSAYCRNTGRYLAGNQYWFGRVMLSLPMAIR